MSYSLSKLPLSCVGVWESDGTSLLQQVGQTALLRLQIRVPANVLLSNEDIGHRALAR